MPVDLTEFTGAGFYAPTINPDAPKHDGEARTFMGDGGPMLKVPFLTRIHAVYVGSKLLDNEIRQQVPVPANRDGVATVTHRTPVYSLGEIGGERVLLRVVQSNDGVWQDRVPVTIYGDWEDSKKKA